MSGMFLSMAELIELTGYRRADAQIRSLNFMGIAHKLRLDGSVVVLRAHVEESLGMKKNSKTLENIDYKINWDAVRA